VRHGAALSRRRFVCLKIARYSCTSRSTRFLCRLLRPLSVLAIADSPRCLRASRPLALAERQFQIVSARASREGRTPRPDQTRSRTAGRARERPLRLGAPEGQSAPTLVGWQLREQHACRPGVAELAPAHAELGSPRANARGRIERTRAGRREGKRKEEGGQAAAARTSWRWSLSLRSLLTQLALAISLVGTWCNPCPFRWSAGPRNPSCNLQRPPDRATKD
jgi:hypothetical protein